MNVALLVERIRVEERQLKEAFQQRGHEATLVAPSSVIIDLNDGVDIAADIAIDRAPMTSEQSILAALLGSTGTPVVNRAATGRLLSDRLALIRHLVIADIPVPKTLITFGEQATLDALETVGYPAVVKSVNVHPDVPIGFIEDRDSAEAIVEHRVMLGEERATLVQQFIPVDASRYTGTIRAAIVGDEVMAFEIREHQSWRPIATTSFTLIESPEQELVDIARKTIARLGTGIYGIDIIVSTDGPVVIGVENLLQFRALKDQGIDIAGKIADFTIGQHSHHQQR